MSKIPHAQKLLETAQKKERKLGTQERRHVVAFLMSTQPELTNIEMGDLFGVAERTIRLDKKTIREEKSKLIREDDVGLIIADILLDYERAIREIEKSARHSKIGSQTRLNHVLAQMELRLKTTKAFQDLGWLPKNLGNMTLEKFEYRAIVHKDTGNVEVRSVDMFDATEGRKQLSDGAATRAALDAEFTENEAVNANEKSIELPKSLAGNADSGTAEAGNAGAAEAPSETA